ncbi:carbohydrate ABC transporter permease [Paenibacillus sp. HJGM_3]|uniref:carbohydrate ABC transporter permease n=1 Tax=Paenibacillus sp. HJGM_3 TaxID=3379816 RepID=UPI00385F66E8
MPFKKTDLVGYAFVAPMLLGIAVFFLYPMLASFDLSFRNANGAADSARNLNNYAWIVRDPNFWSAVFNTIYMAFLSVVTGLVFPFVLASLINSVRWGKGLFKSVFFLPNIVSVVGTAILFTYIFYPTEQGLMNSIIGWIGFDEIGWFSDPRYSKYSIVLMGLWGSLGYNTIIFLAGLQSVPRDLYEAAEVDGANPVQKWWYITIPYLRAIFVFIIVIGTIGSMKRFGDVWMIGGNAGNPNGSLLTIVLYIYRNAFEAYQIGIGSAAAFLLFVIIMIFSLLNLRIFGKNNVD